MGRPGLADEERHQQRPDHGFLRYGSQNVLRSFFSAESPVWSRESTRGANLIRFTVEAYLEDRTAPEARDQLMDPRWKRWEHLVLSVVQVMAAVG